MSLTNSLDNIIINSSAFYLNAITKFLIKTDYDLIIKPIFVGDNKELQQSIQKVFESFTLSEAGNIVVNKFLRLNSSSDSRLLQTCLAILCSNPYLLDLVSDKYNYYKFNSRFIFGSLSQYQSIFVRFDTYQDSIRDYIIEQGLWDEYISALTRPSKIGVILCALIKNARTFLDSTNLKLETEENVKVLNETGDASIDLLFKDENNLDTPVKVSNIKLFDF